MKTSHFFWGVFFLSIGALLLIGNLTTLNFYWDTAWKFWPLVLVLIGVSLLVKNQIGKNIVAALAGLILALTIYATVSATGNFIHNDFHFVFDDSDAEVDSSYFSESYNDSIKTATLNFDGGAGTFKLQTTSDKLAEFYTESYDDNYTLNRIDNGWHTDLNFTMKDKKIRFGKGNYKNSVLMSLNPNPEWQINFDIGASSVDLDLTPYKVSKVDINMGAASLNLKFGDLADLTKFKLNAGASDIDILVPENVGCEITSDAALSSKHFDGFKKTDKKIYRTDNFDSAKKHIYLEIDCGVSSINVSRY